MGREAATVEALRARVRAIEAPRRVRAAPFGAAGVDAALPWGGLPAGCLHEVAGAPGDGAAAVGFAVALLVRLGGTAPVLWCRRAGFDDEHGSLYAPGLQEFGFDPGRLVLVRADTAAGALWAMEEGLRHGGFAAVVGEAGDPGAAESRRLQLAAEASGIPALLLGTQSRGLSVAVTRWQVASAPAGRPGAWRVELARCRGAAPDSWTLEWRYAAGSFAVAAGLRDGPAEPQRTQMAG